MWNWLYPDPSGDSARFWNKGLWCGIAVLATVVFVATFAIERSLEFGRLSVPSSYDDVAYLFDAQSLLHKAAHQPLLTTLHQLLDEHAIIPVVLGSIGFTLMPSGLIGPYILDSVLLLGFLIGCARQLRVLPTAAIIGIVFAVGSIPLASLSITEFRPDIGWGLFTGLAVMAAVSTDIFTASRARIVGAGLLAGLALIGKPTALPATVLALGLAHGGAVLIHWREGRGTQPARPRWSSLALLFASVLAVAGPVYIVVGRAIYNYVIAAIATKDQVAIPGNLYFHLSYYSFGQGGEIVLGSALPICLVIWFVCVQFAAFYSKRMLQRFLVLLATLAATYGVPSLLVIKSVYFGAAFYALLVLSTLYVATQVLAVAAATWPRARAWPVLAGLTFVAGGFLVIKANLIDHPTGLMEPSAAQRQDMADGTARIWGILKEHALAAHQAHPETDIESVIVLAPEPITAGWISLYGEIENVPVRGIGAYYAASLDQLNTLLPNAAYVVAGSSIQHQLFGPRLGDAFTAELNQRDDFQLIGSYQRLSGEPVNLYERLH